MKVAALPVLCSLTCPASDELSNLDQKISPSPWPLSVFQQEFVQDYSRVLGLRCNGALRAFLVLHFLHEHGHIIHFGVDPEWRRQGFGRLLLQASLDFLREQGVEYVFLEVRESNEKALSLYRKFGFQNIGLRERYYSDNHENALIMRLRLISETFCVSRDQNTEEKLGVV